MGPRFGQTLKQIAFLLYLAALALPKPPAPSAPCTQHDQLRKRDHMKLGVRVATARPALAQNFRRALDFWTRVLDMEWYEEDSDACALQLTDAEPGSLASDLVAEAQEPGSSDFQGRIRFSAAGTLTHTQIYYYSVHEIGHLLGLRHNPNHRSVMYFEEAPGPEKLDETDLRCLAALHKMRVSLTEPIYVQRSPWNHVPFLLEVKERVLSRTLENGLIAVLETAKRSRETH